MRARLSLAAFSAPSNSLSNKFVVLGMTADPEPRYAALDISADGAIVKPDTRRPILTYVLQMNGGMATIGIHQREAAIRHCLDFCW